MIDHTNLKPFATKNDIRKLCEEALEFNFAAVCVNSEHISFCTEILKKSEVDIAAVVGFPLGATTSKTKEAETKEAVGFGATEIDMVMDIGSFREGNYFEVGKDIGKVVNAADGAIVKVILETGFLTDDQITKACEIAKNSGAHYVKTSTGFGPMGAFIDHIILVGILQTQVVMYFFDKEFSIVDFSFHRFKFAGQEIHFFQKQFMSGKKKAFSRISTADHHGKKYKKNYCFDYQNHLNSPDQRCIESSNRSL